MKIYNCQCRETCPGHVTTFVAENYETNHETRVGLKISLTVFRGHTVYLFPEDADALGDELKELARRVLLPAGDILDAEARE